MEEQDRNRRIWRQQEDDNKKKEGIRFSRQ
jgi:hypothetical protein